jgi:multiple sugar transport system permease protein
MMASVTADRGVARRRMKEPHGRGFAAYLAVGIILSVIFVLPLAWAVFRSFQAPDLVTAAPTWKDFTSLTFANYRGLIGGGVHILRYVGNSLIVAIGTAVLTAALSTLAGYGFGRFRFRGAGIVFALIIVTLMVPFQAILTPLFLELNAMHLTNSLVGLILFYTTFNLPFGVFVMRNTFLQIPKELEDSAYVDGAGIMTTLFHVLRPLIVPGIATTVLYAFLFAWTEFLGALTFITQDSRITLPVALLNVESGTYGQVNFGYLVSGAVIAMVPCVILYVALQRYYVRGLTSGAVKG